MPLNKSIKSFRYFKKLKTIMFCKDNCGLIMTLNNRYKVLFVQASSYEVTFLCGILGQVWCLIVSIPDICRLSYLNNLNTSQCIIYSKD